MDETGKQPEETSRILVVDDTPANLRLLISTLKQHAYIVHPATSGQAALRFLETMRPDLILLDVRMPEMDGYELCTRLKADPRTRDIPVFFISAADQPLDRVKAFGCGGVDYIVKPFNTDEVVARIETHLALRAMQTRLLARNLELQREVEERRRLEADVRDYAQHLADFSRRLVAVEEEERRQLAATLHDMVAPNLAILKINLGIIGSHLPAEILAELDPQLADTRALLNEINASIRGVCADLRPTLLDYAGLFPALESYGQQFASRTGIAVRLSGADAAVRLSPEVESMLFRVAQEALTNCAKHAGARAVSIDLRHEAGHAVLSIVDDGAGFDPEQLGTPGKPPGLGLLTMRERAEFSGASFKLESSPGHGTRITLAI